MLKFLIDRLTFLSDFRALDFFILRALNFSLSQVSATEINDECVEISVLRQMTSAPELVYCVK